MDFKALLVRLGYDLKLLKFTRGRCSVCKEEIDIDDFNDILSLKEYLYSGICQECFDKIYPD